MAHVLQPGWGMAFVPTRRSRFDPVGTLDTPRDESAAARPKQTISRAVRPPSTPRDAGLAWRAVVHSADPDAIRTEWHLRTCRDVHEAGAHCPEGQRLIETVGEPDGHCLVRGRCARCQAQRRAPRTRR